MQIATETGYELGSAPEKQRPVDRTMKARTLFEVASIVIGASMVMPAQSATSVGSFKQWGAYTSSEGGGKMCFVASQPTDKKYSRSISGRDPAFFMVTTIPNKNIRNEASTIIGYSFADNSKVTIAIDGGSKFTMFTDKDSAWIENPAQEAELIAAMRAGTRMVVEGTSSRGTITTDTYSLSGISAALEAMSKECP
jgi:Invasion associated locus B (IalB) protein